MELGFTCRLANGELAVTTKADSAVRDEKKSPFYLPRNGSETVTLTAGPQPVDPKGDRVSFEDEVMKRLAISLVGLKEGEQSAVELQAERYPATSAKDRFVRMATVRKRQKEMRLSIEEYTNRTGKSPEVGQRFVIDPLLPGRVSEVTDKDTLVLFAPEQGKALTTPFGPITVRETAEQYELVIQAEKEQLVRVGGMVGRISAVESDSFEIDFGHPFGGEKLSCEVKVESTKAADLKVIENNNETVNTSPAALTLPASTVSTESALDPEAGKVFNEALMKAVHN
jgi:FKBP-type peptidyl-prolyl cis-trans isomerase 2